MEPRGNHCSTVRHGFQSNAVKYNIQAMNSINFMQQSPSWVTTSPSHSHIPLLYRLGRSVTTFNFILGQMNSLTSYPISLRSILLENTFQVWRLTMLFYCTVPPLECSVDVLLTIGGVAPSFSQPVRQCMLCWRPFKECFLYDQSLGYISRTIRQLVPPVTI
jgi:hypothetical protein